LGESRLSVPEDLRVWHFAGWRYAFVQPKDMPECLLGHDPTTWPHPWRGFFLKAPPGAKLFITYPELALDLAGNGDPARGAFFRRFLSLFQAPKGTFAFWPFALYEKELVQPYIQHFHEALGFFSPRVVACFGNETHAKITSILAQNHNPTQNNAQFIECPSLADLISQPDTALREIVHILSKGLTDL